MSSSESNGLSAVLCDVQHARGLPNSHYISDSVFEEEKQSVLFDSWAGIAFESDVLKAGDVKPVKLLGMPLIVVRDHDGSIKVYQNTCRHRGMMLVQEPVNVRKVVRCPYHSWCYDLKGELQVTPHVGGPGCNSHESIDRDNLGLHKIACAVWLGVVFVNISGTAAPFEEYTAELRARWGEFDSLALYGDPDNSFELTVNTNWKLAVENYCESYHLPWIHPGLNSYSRLEDHYNIEQRGSFSGQGTVVYQQLKSSTGETFEDLAELSQKWDTAAEYVALYPNVLLGVHRDHTFAILLEPIATNQTIERVALFYTKECATGVAHRSLREKNAALWKSVFEEDIFVVEGMQSGRQGQFFDGGKFSPVMDSPTHNFHHWVAQKLSRSAESSGGSV